MGLIASIIRWSIVNRATVLTAALLVAAGGIYSLLHTPVDALPDLSDVQVIVKTSFPGQSPQIVEDQTTYPLASALMAVPGARHVRGYSFLGESIIYVIFDDNADPRLARGQVLEYLNQARARLPSEANPQLGPDASSLGWIYQYALVDRTGKHNLAELRGLQDWFLKLELQGLPGVAEIADVGGMVKQYQVVIDPGRMRAHALSLPMIRKMILDANREVTGSVIEMGEAEYIIRSKGYIKNLTDLGRIPYLARREAGAALLLSDIAEIREGPRMRRGVAELNGEGEVTGGIIVMRKNADVRTTIAEVKDKLESLKKGLPEGVEIIETYDRSALISRTINTLELRLLEEFLVIAMVCTAFLRHPPSTLAVMLILPIAVLAAFIIMLSQGIGANLMSLGGIAVALGAAADAAIVMVENVHQRLESCKDGSARGETLISDALTEVGPALFFSLLIITLGFLPVFTLQEQEGRLFAPLAYTKTYTMAAAALLSITFIPALISLLIQPAAFGKSAPSPFPWLARAYRTGIILALRRPWVSLGLALLLAISGYWPLSRLGSEFMPRVEEGDLLYMPSTMPGLSIGKARQLLQQTDKLIKTLPEVDSVFGKIGQAETATDPAPLTMLETTIRLKPESQWRAGVTLSQIIEDLDKRVKIPGVVNAWRMPIAARIDMLASGVKTRIGVRISGMDQREIERLGIQVEQLLRTMPDTKSVYAERLNGARYIDINVDRDLAAHYGLSEADLQDLISMAVGGMDITNTMEGRERYAINLRFPAEVRDSLDALKELPVLLSTGQQIHLADIADVAIKDGPEMIKTEDARLIGWVFVDIAGRDLASYVVKARQAVTKNIQLPAGYSISWSGQYQSLARTLERLKIVVPLTLGLILSLLYLNFRKISAVLMVAVTLPMALTGGAWLLYWLDYPFSGAVAVGFIALAGVAAEFGVVMLLFLEQAVDRHQPVTLRQLHEAVIEGAVLRLRPKTMTIAVVIGGLLPIMQGEGAGSDLMRGIAAPLVGGMLTAPLVSMLVIPVIYATWRRKTLNL